jgi:hypothetical protein
MHTYTYINVLRAYVLLERAGALISFTFALETG